MRRPIWMLALPFLAVLFLLDIFWPGMRPVYEGEKQNVQFSGTVIRCIRKYTEEGGQFRIILRHVHCETADGEELTIPFRRKILLLYKLPEEESEAPDLFLPGTILSGAAEFTAFARATNPGQFDARAYYRNEGFYARCAAGSGQCSAKRGSIWHRLIYGIPASLAQLRDEMQQAFFRELPEQEAATASAMVLGIREVLPEDVREEYRKNSISHILAISGLHISIVGEMLYALLLALKVPKKASAGISIAVLILYGMLTGFPVSTSRGVLMLILAHLGTLTDRTYDRTSALLAGAFLILAVNPGELYQAGFQLSFGAVAGIAFVLPVLGGRDCKNPLLTTAAVHVVTLPVLLWHYAEIFLSGFLLNLLVIPLMSIFILTGLAGGLLGAVGLRGSSMFLLGSVYGIFRIYDLLCRTGSKLPGNQQILGQPSFIRILMYYLLLGLVVLLWFRTDRKLRLYRMYRRCHAEEVESADVTPPGIRLIRILNVSLKFFLPFLVLIFLVRKPVLQVTMLDVGQGDGFVITGEDGSCYLVDNGSSSVRQVGKYRLLPYLKYRGIRKVDGIFLTHPDQDHISGVLELIEDGSIRVSCICLSMCYREQPEHEKTARIYELAKQHDISIRYLEEGMTVGKGDVRFHCLWPCSGTDEMLDDNDVSLVLLLQLPGFRMLLTGDIGEYPETEMVNRDLVPAVDLLKVAHHGSRFSSADAFLEQTDAGTAWISCGHANVYGHPHPDVLERLAAHQMETLRTDERGAVWIRGVPGRNQMIYRSGAWLSQGIP